MLILNKYQRTKDGTNVMPLAVSGDIVQCADTKGKVIMKNINDFSEERVEEKTSERVIEVSPIEEMNTDVLLDINKEKMVQYEGELFIEEGEKTEKDNKQKNEQSKNRKPKTRYISDEGYI